MAEAEKKALVAELALQRSEMTASRAALSRELSVSRQLKKSVHKNPKPWVIGGVTTFFALGILFRRRKVVYNNLPAKRGFIRRTTRLVVSLARPALTTLALKYATDYAEAHFGHLDVNSMLGGPSQK